MPAEYPCDCSRAWGLDCKQSQSTAPNFLCQPRCLLLRSLTYMAVEAWQALLQIMRLPHPREVRRIVARQERLEQEAMNLMQKEQKIMAEAEDHGRDGRPATTKGMRRPVLLLAQQDQARCEQVLELSNLRSMQQEQRISTSGTKR